MGTVMWRAVPGYVGLYEVSDEGRIRSLGRRVTMSNGRHKTLASRMLRPTENDAGYLLVTLFDEGGKGRTWRAHRVVALAFLGPQPSTDAHMVRHLDGVRTNNRATNLAWGTAQQNTDDARDHGTAKSARTHCPRGHELTAPNLRPTGRGDSSRRRCLACSKAQQRAGYLRRSLGVILIDSDIQHLADQYLTKESHHD